MEEIKITVAGDFAPIGRTEQFFLKGEYSHVYGNFLSEVNDSDFFIINLESPLVDIGEPLLKTGPNLCSDPRTIEGIVFGGINILTLANNHILDYGQNGLMNTLEIVDSYGLLKVGAGSNINEAQEPLIIEKRNIKIAVVNFCENEFSIASEKKAGANPLNLVENYYQIKKAKGETDNIFVIIHGGHELYNLPSPRMQDISRFFIDIGASVVLWHHSHVLSGMEKYKGKNIFYGLGNFIFDLPNVSFEKWFDGYIVKFVVNDKGINEYKLIPYTQGIPGGVRLLNSKETEIFYSEFDKLSKIISNRQELIKNWENFASQRKNSYLSFFTYRNRLFRRLLKYNRFRNFLLDKKRLLAILNFIRCESHRDNLLYALNKYLSENN